MQEGLDICREIAEKADAKFPGDTDKAMAWARVEAKRRFNYGDAHPFPLDLTMPEVRKMLWRVRGQFNHQQREAAIMEYPSGSPLTILQGKEVSREVIEARTGPAIETNIVRQPDRGGVSRRSMAIVGDYLTMQIEKTQWGYLFGRDLPAIREKYRGFALGSAKVAYVVAYLEELIEPDQQVAEVVSDQQLGELFAASEKAAQQCRKKDVRGMLEHETNTA